MDEILNSNQKETKANSESILEGGGDMGKLIQSMDWSKTPLGPIESWPQSLKTAVSICLASNFPICLVWGHGHVQIYNDGYRPVCGAMHPHSMGQDFTECWASAWNVIGESFHRALAGESSYLENQRIFLNRNGYNEESFFTFSFSPIRDETSGIGGLLHPAVEQTEKMLSERRTGTLRELTTRIAEAKSVEDVFKISAQVFTENNLDVSFLLLYQVNTDGTTIRLIANAGLATETAASPLIVEIQDASFWPFREAANMRRGIQVDELEKTFGPLPCEPYPESPKTAFVLPINPPGTERPSAFLVAGMSARLPLTEVYQNFFDLVSSSITAAVANAQAYEEERKRAEALAKIDHAKTVFFSNVSHEFRTPLTLMLGPLEDLLAKDKNLILPENREMLIVAHRNALRLQKLVNTLLDFSRIEAGRVQASYRPTDLPKLTSELASNFRSAIEKAGLKLTVDCRSLSKPVYIDHDMWEKIVLNLLSNAFKHTFEGEIKVAIRQSGDKVILTIKDTGIGVPPDQLLQLFERFHRVENARSRTHEGSGIGLALVNELVKLHGGIITAESIVDAGTTFTVSIPSGKSHLPEDRIEAESILTSKTIGIQSFTEEALRWLPEEDRINLSVSSSELDLVSQDSEGVWQGTSPGDNRKARIILADDNADMRDYIRRLLLPHCDVEAVQDGEAALNAARRQTPDLVLSDVMMPKMDGFKFLSAFRNDPNLQSIPVILLSARAGGDAKIEGLQAGADDYLTKPFSAHELLARVKTNLDLARLRREVVDSEREQKERLQAAMSASKTGTFRWDIQSNALDWDKNLDSLFGLPPGETLRSLEDFIATIHPEEQAAVISLCEQCATQATDFDMEFRVVWPDGSIHWLDDKGKTYMDEHGKPLYITGACVDITERKLAQEKLKIKNEQLIKINNDLDNFIYTASHDLKAPVSNLEGLFKKLLSEIDLKDDLLVLKSMIEKSFERFKNTINDLTEITKVQKGDSGETEVIRLSEIVDDLKLEIKDQIEKYNAEIQAEFAVPELRFSRKNLRSIIYNIISNAIKYSAPERKPVVKISTEKQNDFVVLAISDNGLGLSLKNQTKMFTMFKRFHDHVEGTGIGLYIVKRIIDNAGGKIEIESEVGKGSTFKVYFKVQ